jgi:hypothetical protein
MATEYEEDLVEAATCLLAHGVTLYTSALAVRPAPHGFEIYEEPQVVPVQTFSVPDEAARYLVIRLHVRCAGPPSFGRFRVDLNS